MDWNTAGLLIIAVFNALTAFLSYRTHQAVMVVEKATNSMKDALVATTAEASHLAGEKQGRLDQQADMARTDRP